jgi:5-methyltetrahydrofolate--homocysteine methyltransferase
MYRRILMSLFGNEIKEAIISLDIASVGPLTNKALADGVKPKQILDDGLLIGMAVVGERFKRSEMFVPEVLMAAKAMTEGLNIIKPLLAGEDAKGKGTVVLGTVKGDLHDIGKRIVAMMFEGAGFDVIDLGYDVAPEAFVSKVKETNACIVGMSAMLTTTMMQMKITVDALKEAGLYDKVGVMVGGAPLTVEYAEGIGAKYSPDAQVAVEVANNIVQ